jgi:UDP-GlcNAc:undecaprenyl-phosphate GlcNAc-1-phosphate transferase
VCDGLVAGLAVIALALVGASGAQGALPWITIGACLGFLAFNRPPASIFLGDGGSLLLGFLVAAALIPTGRLAGATPWAATWPAIWPTIWKDVAAALLATGVLLFEAVLLVHSRVRKGIPWWRGSPDHFSLRLQAHGFTRLQTDAIAWGAATGMCAVAFLLPRLPHALAWRALQHLEVQP